MDIKLSNIANATGTYNDIETTLMSNTSIVNIINGLTLEITADKINWTNGLLTYTLTIKNETATSYISPVIEDVIDTTKATFVSGSVYIDETEASAEQVSYNQETHTLSITLDEVPANTTKVITFQVEKVL